jgi:ribosomal protein S14
VQGDDPLQVLGQMGAPHGLSLRVSHVLCRICVRNVIHIG